MITIDPDMWFRISQSCPKCTRKRDKLHQNPGATNGRPRTSDHLCFAGVLFILLTGMKWKSLPDHYPSSATCWRRLREWESNGVFECMWRSYIKHIDLAEAAIWHASFSKASYFQTVTHLSSRSTCVFQKAERPIRAMMARIFIRKFGKRIREGQISSEESFDNIYRRMTAETRLKTLDREPQIELHIDDQDTDSLTLRIK